MEPGASGVADSSSIRWSQPEIGLSSCLIFFQTRRVSAPVTPDQTRAVVARAAELRPPSYSNRSATGSTIYSYDGDGKRVSKTVGGTQTNYTYDVNASLPVLLDDGTRKCVWGLGLAFAVDISGSPLVYHTDGLGSMRAPTDASGSVVQTCQYDEYGNVVSSSGSIT